MWHHISKIVLRRYYTYQPNWNNSIEKHWTLHIEQLNQYTAMTFHVHVTQFDVTPSRTNAGISLICDYLINCETCDVTLGRGGLRNVTTCDKDGGRVKKSWNLCDEIYGWPLSTRTKGTHEMYINIVEFIFLGEVM